MNDNLLLIDVNNFIATLTIHREERRNSLSPELIEILLRTLDEFEHDPSVRAICLTGSGKKAFCSGADLMASLNQSTGDPLDSTKSFANLLQKMRAYPKPLIARINGYCLGGGLGLALACDIAIAQDQATFGTPETKVGLFPMMISPLILEHMPRKHAMKMMLCGEKINAQTAKEFNLINEIVPPEELDSRLEQLFDALRKAAPLAQQQGIQAIHEVKHLSDENTTNQLATHLHSLMQTEDAIEGISAFLEKRPPQWKGK